MAVTQRVMKHPVLDVPEKNEVKFYFDGKEYTAKEGEIISSALFANGITVFGHHHIDGSSQGIFCANGQCSQCMVIADGRPVKACMTAVHEGMKINSCNGLPALPTDDNYKEFAGIKTLLCEVMIIGGGPSGIAAAIELGKLGHSVILVDDKEMLGGKLVLQTHTFFGSRQDCYAGTRGIDIAKILTSELAKYNSVRIHLNSTATGVFSDKRVGVLQKDKYFLVEPKKLLVATGARERALNFPGWDLPGVYGAGAFQTLLNRDLVKPSQRLFIIGGGNVGLIAAYHAMQAGIKVVGLAEALPQPSGYKVHADKVKRLGMPIYLSHSVTKVGGDENGVKTVTIAEVDNKFKPIKGTEKTFEADTVLVAVGLSPIDEFISMAKDARLSVYSAGDAKEIAEASAAMFGGKIAGLQIAKDLGDDVVIPNEWHEKEEVLKSRPGETIEMKYPDKREGVFPVFHCCQEIPCNPCTEACPKGSISIKEGGIMGLPSFEGECTGCRQCVAACPGLAITLADFRNAEQGFANVTVPFELLPETLEPGAKVPILDINGNLIGEGEVVKIISPKFADRTNLLTLKVPADIAVKVAGVKIQNDADTKPIEKSNAPEQPELDDVIVCNCMRVSSEKIREKIRAGVRDLNQLKGELHTGMGACGGKTCGQLIMRILREEGVEPSQITSYTNRTPCIEIPLGVFAGINK